MICICQNNRLGTRPVISTEHMGVLFVCSGCTKKNINILLWPAVITRNTCRWTCRHLQKTWWMFQASGLHFDRLTHSSSVMRSLFTGEYWYSSLCVLGFVCSFGVLHMLRRKHLEVFPICYILVFEKMFWACQNYLEWRCYRSNQFDFPVFLVIEGVNYRVDIYPEITVDMNKDQWIKPGICHGSSKKCFDSFHGV